MNRIRDTVIPLIAGTATALLWSYVNTEIIGYLAIWRFPDRWPLAMRLTIPALAFLAVVTTTYWLYGRAFRQRAYIAILAAGVSYALLVVWAHLTVLADRSALLLSGMLVAVALVPAAMILAKLRRNKA